MEKFSVLSGVSFTVRDWGGEEERQKLLMLLRPTSKLWYWIFFPSSKSLLLITTSQFLKDKKKLIQAKRYFIYLKIHSTAGKSHYTLISNTHCMLETKITIQHLLEVKSTNWKYDAYIETWSNIKECEI